MWVFVLLYVFLLIQSWGKGQRRDASLGRRFLQISDLFDQVRLFVVELLVICAILLEVAQELDQFGLVLEQDVDDGLRLVGVRYKNLRTGAAENIFTYNACLQREFTFCTHSVWGSVDLFLMEWINICCVYMHERGVFTLKTWKASNWMLGLLSRSRFIISLRFSGLLMQRVITVKLCLSNNSSPKSWKREKQCDVEMIYQRGYCFLRIELLQ